MMSREVVWTKFIENMLDLKIKELNKTREYELIKNRNEEIDDELSVMLMNDERQFIEEILFEINLRHEQEQIKMYEQGIKDGVQILKRIGVL